MSNRWSSTRFSGRVLVAAGTVASFRTLPYCGKNDVPVSTGIGIAGGGSFRAATLAELVAPSLAICLKLHKISCTIPKRRIQHCEKPREWFERTLFGEIEILSKLINFGHEFEFLRAFSHPEL
jgi:hypothetical protein